MSASSGVTRTGRFAAALGAGLVAAAGLTTAQPALEIGPTAADGVRINNAAAITPDGVRINAEAMGEGSPPASTLAGGRLIWSTTNEPIYGNCADAANIHTRPDVAGTVLGVCQRGDRYRSNRIDKGSLVRCGGSGRLPTDTWFYVRDLRTNVVGWVSGCYV